MTCKFCGQNKKLIKAHIIPECFWVSSGEKSSSQYLVTPLKEEFPRRRPIGIYDQNLVCLECEQIWNDYDTYSCELLSNQFQGKLNEYEGFKWYVIDSYNYSNLKLFFMSLLWRASASKEKFFNEVSIGCKFDGEIRDSLRNRNPKTYQDFSVVILRSDKFVGEHSIIDNPIRKRLDEVNFYKFYVGEFFVWIKVDRQKLPLWFEPFVLKPNSKLLIPVSERDDDGLRAFVGKLNASNKRVVHHFQKFVKLYSDDIPADSGLEQDP